MDDTHISPLQRLFEFSLEFAQNMLAENGEFFPFGATVSEQGEIGGLGGDIDTEEQPTPGKVYEKVSSGLVEAAARPGVSAVALVANVVIPEDFEVQAQNAIRVQLEADGFARFIHVPYILWSDEQPGVELLDPILDDIEPMYFRAPGNA